MLPTLEIRDTSLDESPTRKKSSPYVLRHFRGELPFRISFWVNYVGGLVFINVALRVLVFLKDDVSIVTLSFLSLSSSLLTSIAIPWLMVGTWRSASKYVSSGGTRLWSYSVKMVILIGLYHFIKLLLFHTIPMLGVHAEILLGDKDTPAYEIRVYDDGQIIQFRGGLRAGSDREFKKKLASSRRIRLLEIESGGGWLGEGVRIGRMVRAGGLATYVPNSCKSAATFLLISGNERLITPGAKIGFHRPSGDEECRSARQFMEECGIAKDFIDRVLSTSNDDMWYPTYEEMKRAGVVTGKLVDEKIQR